MTRTMMCRLGALVALFSIALTVGTGLVAKELTVEEEASPEIHPRHRLFGAPPGEGTTLTLPMGGRLLLVYSPKIEDCTPQELALVRAVQRLEGDLPDLEVVTLVPETVPPRLVERGVFGEPFPGHLVRASAESWSREENVTPRPRIEVWSHHGELLLLKSIPPRVTEEAIYDEILWTRAFTHPLAEGAPSD